MSGMRGTERKGCKPGKKPSWSLQRADLHQPRKTTGSWWLTAARESFTEQAVKNVGPAPANMPDFVASANGKLE